MDTNVSLTSREVCDISSALHDPETGAEMKEQAVGGSRKTSLSQRLRGSSVSCSAFRIDHTAFAHRPGPEVCFILSCNAKFKQNALTLSTVSGFSDQINICMACNEFIKE